MIKINGETPQGGAVVFNQEKHVWASFGVSQPEQFFAGLRLPGGKTLSLFVDRETGLVVVEVINTGHRSGRELFRETVIGESAPAGHKWVAESMEVLGTALQEHEKPAPIDNTDS